jgi:radical SAM-linked protein
VIGTAVFQKLRLRFKRTGAARFLSHLQQIDAIRRAVAASPWPVSSTNGKRSRPKISFGPAISVGYESFAEYCDVDMEKRLDLSKAKEELNPHLGEGFELLQAKSVPRFFPSLDVTLNAALYQIAAPQLAGSEAKWEAFDKQAQFIVVKKKADRDVLIDAKPIVRSWKLQGNQMDLCLRFGPGRTLKPEKIIQAVCGLTDEECAVSLPTSNWRISRAQLFFEKQSGELVEP